LFYRKNLLSIEQFVLPEEFSSGKLPEEPSSGSFSEEGSSDRINCSSGRRFFQKATGRKFFRMNKLFYQKNLLPVAFRKNFLSEEEIIFFNTRTILPIHLIVRCTSNVAGCT